MYLDFFGLNNPPFRITPDTKVFFEGNNRGAILNGLCFLIERGEGIIKIVGEVGTGKTMLCRMLPLKLNDSIDWVYLAHPSLSPEHTLHAIAHELGISISQDTEKHLVMRKLHDFLLDRHSKNRRVVVLVEEAQGMPIESLEEVRLLSNLETDESKLLQIVLFGQPELDEKLANKEIRQLKERITHELYLPPLDSTEIHEYLNFRLRSAGYRGPNIFSKKISKLITHYSGGLTRRVNIIADKVLMSIYSKDCHSIQRKDVKQAIFDTYSTTRKKEKKPYTMLFIALITSFLVLFTITKVNLTPDNNRKIIYQGKLDIKSHRLFKEVI